MSANYVIEASQQQLARHYQVFVFGHIERTELHPQHLAPTILRLTSGERRLQEMRWACCRTGRWRKTTRRSRARRKPTESTRARFSAVRFKHRRCLMPATAFYEWREENRQRVRYGLSLPGHSHFAFAGLWNLWRDELYTCTLVMAEASQFFRPFHRWQPVTLTSEQYAEWLDPRAKLADLKAMLRAWPGELRATPEPAPLLTKSAAKH